MKGDHKVSTVHLVEEYVSQVCVGYTIGGTREGKDITNLKQVTRMDLESEVTV